jgi:hypothetical protein
MQPESRQYGDCFRGQIQYQGSLHHAGLYVPVQQRHATSRHARQHNPWRRSEAVLVREIYKMDSHRAK